MKARHSTWTPRLAITSRVVAATLGCYALATLASIVLAPLLPGSRADRVLGATQLSFAIYAAAILWVFSARDATRVWLGLLATMAVLGALAVVVT